MKKYIIFGSFVVVVVVLTILARQPVNKAMNLKDWKKVYVLLSPASLTGGMDMTPGTAKPMMATDMPLVFQYADSTYEEEAFPALIVYSETVNIPPGSMYATMRVRQSYQTAIDDPKAKGIHVNYQSTNMTAYVVTEAQLIKALPKLNKDENIKYNVNVNL